MKRIYLHIGMSKAGSTAIQDSLVRNRRALSSAGKCFPEVGRFCNSHYLIYREFREDRPQLLKQAVAETDHNEVIISDEAFWTLGSNQVKKLAVLLEEYEVQILLYLRNPWSYVSSSYRQSIKGPGRAETCREHIKRLDGRLDYPALIALWSSLFDTRVRVYESLREGVVGDFFEAISVPVPTSSSGIRANTTPHDSVLQFIWFCNRFFPRRISTLVRRQFSSWQIFIPFLPKISNELLYDYATTEVEKWDLKRLEDALGRQSVAQLTRLPTETKKKHR